MKIAITSENSSMSSNIDSRFGRAAYFAVYDTETKHTIFLENEAKNASEGAGPATVQFLAEIGVSKIVSGEFGGKVKALISSLQIEVQIEKNKSIKEIINNL